MSDLVAVTAIGNDRPGIVAGVTQVLYEAGCNLEDASSTILRGHFAMTLIVRVADGMEASELEGRLAPVATEMDLVVTVRPVGDAHPEVAPSTHVVSVYGADKPGIVFRVAEALARAGVNITALSSRVLGDEQPVYALLLEVAAAAPHDIEADLARLRDELGVDVTVRPMEPDLL